MKYAVKIESLTGYQELILPNRLTLKEAKNVYKFIAGVFINKKFSTLYVCLMNNKGKVIVDSKYKFISLKRG